MCNITFPTRFTEDPVKELVSRLTGSESILKRVNLTLESVQQNILGVKQLIV